MAKKTYPKISVLLPGMIWGKDWDEFWRAFEKLDYPVSCRELILIDDSGGNLRLGRKKGVVKIVNKQRLGFAGSINLAARQAFGDYFLVVNEDVVLPADFLKKMVGAMKANPDWGVAGPLVFSKQGGISERDRPVAEVDFFRARVKTVSEEELRKLKKPKEVSWISGCTFLVRRKLFKNVGGFWEKLFAYWEDADFCMRVRENLGKKVVFLPEARVIHRGSVVYRRKRKIKDYYLLRNGFFFWNKWANFWGRSRLWLVTVFWFWKSFLKGEKEHCQAVWDFWHDRGGEK